METQGTVVAQRRTGQFYGEGTSGITCVEIFSVALIIER